MAPVILALRSCGWARVRVIATAQHRRLLDQVLGYFGLVPDVDMDLMQPDQSLALLTARLMTALDECFAADPPDLVLAQGDTTTVMVAALAAFYRRIRFGHVEAGLRTGDRAFPFPEEANRVIADYLSEYMFAPTARARDSLRREGLDAGRIYITGNTVIDALFRVRARRVPLPFALAAGRRLILVTAHRRENFGAPLEEIGAALRDLADRFADVEVVYPVHPNPNVTRPARRLLSGHPRIRLIEPLDYPQFVATMEAACLILTDSGGVQEEAPALGKPVLVLRDETERPEAVEAGVVRLVGPHRGAIVTEAARLLTDPAAYAAVARGVSPYGDGRASERITAVLAQAYGAEVPAVA
ncbi:MAG: UDP-N-acetylglucosamine 2-epimerase (non-hydrolyzing), partial [bacterium]|nr:UDP-N-acetylglucosamine 2-epimerase (non-hydrolyzing) [bacterium]